MRGVTVRNGAFSVTLIVVALALIYRALQRQAATQHSTTQYYLDRLDRLYSGD